MTIYSLIHKAQNFNTIYIFGYYQIGMEVHEELSYHLKKSELFFCDNNLSKQDNIRVFSVSEAVRRSGDALFIIVSLYHSQTMMHQLLNEGINRQNIEEYVPPIYVMQKNTEQMLRRITPWAELKFEVTLAEHCNLNCKYCDHFSPLAVPEIPDFNKFESDIHRLSTLFHHKAKRISLLGGEPLLNDEIIKYMVCTRKYFENARIDITTNGTLLFKMQEAFWNTCRELCIEIRITKYPIEFNYHDIEEKCTEENVKWYYFGDTSMCKYSHYFPLDVNGKQDARYSFLHCGLANNCITLHDGRLYTCSVIPNIVHFNRFFAQNLELTDRDSIDIYKCAKAEEVMDFLSRPVPFCRYCNIRCRTEGNEWGISKKEITEWT